MQTINFFIIGYDENRLYKAVFGLLQPVFIDLDMIISG